MRAPLLLATAALLLLGACASDGGGKPADPAPLTPTERYSIEVKPAPEELQLAAHADGLSPQQTDALREFVAAWQASDRGEITIKAPEHGPPPAAAYRTATQARDLLVAEGAEAAEVRIVGYEARGDARAPVRVGFVRYRAKGPQCGRSWDNLADVRANAPYAEFGCSMTANIAAQIANPEDLLHPRAMTPPDAERREKVLDKYREGENTSTAKDSQANGTFSSVGQ